MDTKIIEYIIAIAEEKSLSRAAEKLYITQPALSQRVKKLEAEIGTPIFTRDREGLFLTDAGRIYVNGGHSILNIKQDAMNRLSQLQNKAQDVFRFGCATSNAWDCVPAFREKYPDIELKTTRCLSPQAKEDLIMGRMDLAVLLTSSLDHSILKYVPLSHGDLLLAIPNGPNCTRQDDIEKKNYAVLKDDYFILSHSPSFSREMEEHAMDLMGIHPPLLCEINDHISRRYMLNKGLGNAFLPDYNVKKGDRYHCYRVDPSLSYYVVAAYSKNTQPTDAMKYMLELLLSIFDPE